MEIVTTGERIEFSPEVIKKRGFLRAKYIGWDEPRNGLIVYAGREYLKVLFQTGINIATSFYVVKASEVAAGQWDLAYSNDLTEAYLLRSADSRDLIAEVRKLFREDATDDSVDEGQSD